MLFVTVGTSFSFDRLVTAVEQAVLRGAVNVDVFAQIGRGGYVPRSFPSTENLSKMEYDRWFRSADAIVGHAGMGTISMALELSKPILVMPRLRKYREIVNSHQLRAAREYAARGHVLAAYSAEDVAAALEVLISFKPLARVSAPASVAERIGRFIGDQQYRRSRPDSRDA